MAQAKYKALDLRHERNVPERTKQAASKQSKAGSVDFWLSITSQGDQERPEQPHRASQGVQQTASRQAGSQIEPAKAPRSAQGSQIEPVRAPRSDQSSQIEPARAPRAARSSQSKPDRAS